MLVFQRLFNHPPTCSLRYPSIHPSSHPNPLPPSSSFHPTLDTHLSVQTPVHGTPPLPCWMLFVFLCKKKPHKVLVAHSPRVFLSIPKPNTFPSHFHTTCHQAKPHHSSTEYSLYNSGRQSCMKEGTNQIRYHVCNTL